MGLLARGHPAIGALAPGPLESRGAGAVQRGTGSLQ